MRGWFKRRRDAAAPVTKHYAVPKANYFDKDAARALGLRKNMWVQTHTYGVGLITALSPDGVAEVMLVDDGGYNKVPVIMQANTLRQALHAEIPGPRRPNPDFAAAVGYM